MDIKQCKKLTGDSICIRIDGHAGPCESIPRQQFEKTMKTFEGDFLLGCSARQPRDGGILNLTGNKS